LTDEDRFKLVYNWVSWLYSVIYFQQIMDRLSEVPYKDNLMMNLAELNNFFTTESTEGTEFFSLGLG